MTSIILPKDLSDIGYLSPDYPQILSAKYNHNGHPTEVIVKQFMHKNDKNMYDTVMCKKEILMMYHIKQNTQLRIPEFIGYCIRSKLPSYIIMEKINAFDLMYYITDHPLSNPDSLLLIKKIVLAVHELHKVNIVHRDIKAENILVKIDNTKDDNDDDKIQIVMIDFGFSTLVQDNTRLHERLGTVPLYSPSYYTYRITLARLMTYGVWVRYCTWC